jgi:fused signal recognition particle receptor
MMGLLGNIFKNLFSRGIKGREFEEELQKTLYGADLGPQIVDALLSKLKNIDSFDKAKSIINTELHTVLKPMEGRLDIGKSPYVIMLVGVNGVGKTTLAARLSNWFKSEQNKKVMLVAADTFRAAAVEQLKIWSDRIGCGFYCKEANADPGATAYEGIKKAVDEKFEIVIVDTGGRLHTKDGLMHEIAKVQRVSEKVLAGAPHLTLLVLDSTQGQNMLKQSSVFSQFLKLDGLVLTKTDGTAKGGGIVGIVKDMKLPIYFMGTGEGLSDLIIFDTDKFLARLR